MFSYFTLSLHVFLFFFLIYKYTYLLISLLSEYEEKIIICGMENLKIPNINFFKLVT